MPAENVLEVHHLKKSVGQGEHELSILTGVNLIVKPAQTLALIGESGSGKSTLLAILFAAGFVIGWLICGLFWLRVRVSLARAERKLKRLEQQLTPASTAPVAPATPVVKE